MHLRSFHIRRFRTFDELRLPTLGDVNLIVGRNNVGKTMLLEAIQLHAAKGDSNAIRALLTSRDEFQRIAPVSSRSHANLNLSALLHGRRPKIADTIALGPINAPSSTLRMRFGNLGSEGSKQRRRLGLSRSEPPNSDRFGLEVSYGPESVSGVLTPSDDRPRSRWDGHSLSPALHAPFVPSGQLSDQSVAAWWDTVSLTDAEDRIIRCLRIITPVEKIALVQHPDFDRDRTFLLRVEGEPAPIPLRSLGDGLGRMLWIALALEGARKTGVLLIDEIENGIHYTALPELWTFINQAARMHGVQVFATSHSWDCVDAFQRVAKEDTESKGVLIRLMRKGETIRPVIFSEEELAIAARDDIEVR